MRLDTLVIQKTEVSDVGSKMDSIPTGSNNTSSTLLKQQKVSHLVGVCSERREHPFHPESCEPDFAVHIHFNSFHSDDGQST
jgi:hypothetical protein